MPETQYKLQTKKPNTISLLLIYGQANLLTVALTPALAMIGVYYNITRSELNYVTIVALIGYAFGPLLNPIISVRHGRKGTLIISMILTLVGILGSLFFTIVFKSFYLNMVFRLISILGAGSAMATIPSIISDFYFELEAKKLLFLVSAVFCIFPGIIMMLCGILAQHFGWISCEYFMLLYAIATFFMIKLLPETTLNIDKNANVLKTFINTSSLVLKDSSFIIYTSLSSFSVIVIYYFVAEAPLISFHYLKMDSSTFGYLSIIPYLGAMLSILTARHFAAKLSFKTTIIFGNILLLVSSIVMVLMFACGYINLFSLFILSTFMIIGVSPALGYGMALAVNTTPHKAIASAYFLFIVFLLSAIIPMISNFVYLYLGVMTYPVVLLILSIISILIFVIFLIWEKKQYK